ncbi:MAG: tetratricopeptide repeat protein [Acidimicrobiales bacterium]
MNELEQERDFLLRSLTDLEAEREAGDLSEDDFVALRDGYTARAAAALRKLEPAPETGVPPAAPAPPPPTRRRRAGLVTAAVVLTVAVGAGAMVALVAGQRLPGDPTTGSIEATGPSAALAQARALYSEGATLEAIKVYDQVLETTPDQPEALTYRGWFVLLAGRDAETPELVTELTARGLASIERAIAVDPAYPDAHYFRGLVMFVDRLDPAAAVIEMRAFLAGDGPRLYQTTAEDVLRQALAQTSG